MLSRVQEYDDLERVPMCFGRAEPSLRLDVGRRGLAGPDALMQMSSLKGQAAESKRPADRGRPRRKRILLVDDQQNVREAIRLLLGLDEHAVTEAESGPAALDLFRHDHFDLVITDFEMPIMKGNELAARIKQLSPSQPVLMITAYAGRLSDSGNAVDGILDKPFHLEDLRQLLEKLLS